MALPALKRGEYDLVNISLIGHDPITGRSFDACQDEWRSALRELEQRIAKLRWWDLPERVSIARQTAILQVRQDM